MFTGLIEGIGELIERKQTDRGFRLRIGTSIAPELSAGDSLAVNGVCLTVILAEHQEVHADVGPETARVTTLGWLMRGSRVNLERPLRPDGRPRAATNARPRRTPVSSWSKRSLASPPSR